ncbi:hypothetical protein GIW77_16080 [Pseudomonas simiae]|uniref:DNA binding HTH domain-containing protein n=1 Tax=Pseudomonas simiae TaxID=321846 RepID=A0ABS9G905_9PSED|nr:hypothetical protein [Pseudomonas simiae]MCF5047708.1 hypothetical protein [Pseudomonas simiae]MCF5188081.1 hypothetical protein [Pseudomonas simiae]MCF5286961.1 hypothetical protein [Pseudomonas simiae]MCF5320007.1 hypothetical protein [Pseudomonas simiae]MCF5336901.1 hypothetical protein [Pseudomonas simiae]
MISNHLSLVEALRPASDELAAQVAEFVAAGGEIEQAPAYNYKPKPITYSNQMPPAPKPFVRRRVEPIEPPPPTPLEIRQEQRRKRVELVMQLAPTHTQSEVIEITGIGRRTLLAMSKEFDFKFKRSAHGGHNSPERKKALAERDAVLVERIKAYKDLGISRRRVCVKLHITSGTLKRILEKYSIDYPMSAAGGNRCAA